MDVTTSAPRPPAASDNRPETSSGSTHNQHETFRRLARARRRTATGILTLGLMLCDVLAINGAFIGVYLLNREHLVASTSIAIPNESTTIWFYIVLSNLAFALAFGSQGLYWLRRGASRIDEAYKVSIAILLATIVVTQLIPIVMPSFGYQRVPWTPQTILLAATFGVIATLTIRSFHRWLVTRLRSNGIDTVRTVIVGAREPGLFVWRTIRRAPELGYRVQGMLSNNYPLGTVVEDLPVLGRVEQLGRVVRATRADEVIIALSKRSQQDLMDIVALAEDEAVAVRVYPDTFQLITNNEVSIGDISGLPLISVRNAALENPWNQFLKRMLDVVVSVLVLIVLSPLMLLVALLIRLDSPGKVFFIQERVGLDNRPFNMLKFRTMRNDAEARGPGWTTANDPRITRLGSILRRTSIDELPQFINVLLGEMSVVGPRPEQPQWVVQFEQQIPHYMRRHKEKAGVTGWAQVNGLRGDTSIEERTRYDLYYIENWSLLFDIKIIIRTIVSIISGTQKNAY